MLVRRYGLLAGKEHHAGQIVALVQRDADVDCSLSHYRLGVLSALP
jgi:hypothetical protein